MKRIFCLVVALMVMPSIAIANTDKIINGVTEFLIERAKENNFYIFETKLAADNDLKTYFPHTYLYVSEGDLKVLLTSKEIWKKAVEDDLDTLITRSFAASINKEIDLANAATVGMDRYLDLFQYLSMDINGVEYPLNVVPIGATQDMRDTINGFWTEPVILRDELIVLGDSLKAYANVTNVTQANSSDLLQKAKALKKAFNDLDKFWRHIEAHKSQLRINTAAVKASCAIDLKPFFCQAMELSATEQLQQALGETKAPLANVLGKTSKLMAFLDEILKPSQAGLPPLSRTEKVIMSMRFLKDIGLGDSINIDRLKRHVLFFARLSEIQSKEEVKEILVEYTLPAVSFNIKREKDTTHFLLTAYLGYAYGKTYSDDSDGKKNDHGIIAPIGLELSRGTDNFGSFSVMLAPVDLGYPVTLKLNGIEEKLAFSDIFAPGIYFAYGFRGFPANIGIAYQRGRRLPTSNDTEYRALAFISYDMPLLNLY